MREELADSPAFTGPSSSDANDDLILFHLAHIKFFQMQFHLAAFHPVCKMRTALTRVAHTMAHQIDVTDRPRLSQRSQESAMSADDFFRLCMSNFIPAVIVSPPDIEDERIFSFDVTCESVSTKIEVHTSSKRTPSRSFVHVLCATVASLERLYGPCPHDDGVQLLVIGGPPRTQRLNGFLGVEHVNSGFSYRNSTRGTAVVYRCAEAHRTLVHELLHVWQIHGPDEASSQKSAAGKLGAPPNALLSEALVEAVAWLILRGLNPTTSDGLELRHSHTLSSAYFKCACDDGSTNAWAYIVGRFLLIADGGHKLSSYLCRGLIAQKVTGAQMYDGLVSMMAGNRHLLSQHKDVAPLGVEQPIRMVQNDFGDMYRDW